MEQLSGEGTVQVHSRLPLPSLAIPAATSAVTDIVVPAHGPLGTADELAAEVSRLRQMLMVRDDLLSMAAHELRNPLHALALQLALARTNAQAGNPGDAADRIRRAEATLKRYSERVTVLMDLMAAPMGAFPLTPRDIDLGALVTSLAESLDQEARTRGIELRVEMPEDPLRRPVDPVAVEQVIDNLLLNAFKHSAARIVTVRLHADATGWSVAVTDDGRGIAHEDQQEIFRKSAVATHSPRGAGTGLGLWIASRLVEAMRGQFHLASAPGAGSTFSFHVPTGAPTAAPAPVPPSSVAP